MTFQELQQFYKEARVLVERHEVARSDMYFDPDWDEAVRLLEIALNELVAREKALEVREGLEDL
jgi:hypothetical protein